MATRTIGTELVLAGEKEFNDGMKAVNSNLKNIKSDMALVTAEFDGNADSMEALTAKQKVLRESVDQHQAKVDALRKMYEKQKKAYGENSAQADKYKQQLNNATVALLKEQKALDKTTEALEDQRKENNRLGNATKDSAEDVEDAAKSQKKLEKAADATKKALSGVGKVAGGMGKMVLGTAKSSVAGVLALGVAAATSLAVVTGWAKEQAEAAKAASEAGEELDASQEQWLSFSKQLDSLDGSVSNAKSAIAGILLPMLGDLTEKGSKFLDSFSQDMTAAAGDTQRQTQILGRYIADGSRILVSNLPAYVEVGKDLFGSLFDGLLEGVKDGKLLDAVTDLFSSLIGFIADKGPEMFQFGLKSATEFLEGLNGYDLGQGAGDFLINLYGAIEEEAPTLIPAAATVAKEFIKGLAGKMGAIWDAGTGMSGAVWNGIVSAAHIFRGAGDEIIAELVAGLLEAEEPGVRWAGEYIKTLYNEFVRSAQEIGRTGATIILPFNGLLFPFLTETPPAQTDGSHANGLGYVPYDGYLAELHRGEAVLTAQEAAAYRSGQTGGKTFNMNIYTMSISKEDMAMMAEYMDEKMGDDLP